MGKKKEEGVLYWGYVITVVLIIGTICLLAYRGLTVNLDTQNNNQKDTTIIKNL